MTARYDAMELQDFATALLAAAGLAPERAACVAEVLLEGDLLGRSTHGLALLAPYLGALEEGSMAADGDPVVVADHGSVLHWDGRLLPGPWLLTRAMDEALARLAEHPVVTVSIRRSHHLAALGAYLERATARCAICLLTATDPAIQSVAPFGGLDAVLTSNPIAAGIPNGDDPILIDISTSLVSNAGLWRHRARGEPLPGPWLRRGDGSLTDDAAAIDDDPPATIMALGGEDLGYKGFALGLLVEALALALSGHRRPTTEDGWSEGVFLQLIDPERFAGGRNFSDAVAWLVAACRQSRVPEGAPPVRLPGEAARRRRAEQRTHGVILDPAILEKLAPWAERYAITPPAARSRS